MAGRKRKFPINYVVENLVNTDDNDDDVDLNEAREQLGTLQDELGTISSDQDDQMMMTDDHEAHGGHGDNNVDSDLNDNGNDLEENIQQESADEEVHHQSDDDHDDNIRSSIESDVDGDVGDDQEDVQGPLDEGVRDRVHPLYQDESDGHNEFDEVIEEVQGRMTLFTFQFLFFFKYFLTFILNANTLKLLQQD